MENKKLTLLRKLLLETVYTIPAEVLQDLAITEILVDELLAGLLVRVRQEVWTEVLKPVVVSYPASWWDHVKRDVFKCKKYKTREEIVYPHVFYRDITFPDVRSTVVLVTRDKIQTRVYGNMLN
jgi:hypothetical protein